jgi:hypothetical protein
MKERASAPGGCWKVQSIRLHLVGWFLQVTKQAIKADYLVCHDTPSAARGNRTHLVHATCHRTKHPSRLAGNTVLQQMT